MLGVNSRSAVEGNLKFIFLGGQRVAAVTNSPSIGSTTLYYHADHLGGANVLTDSTGFKKELIEYEPFGQESRHEKYGSSEEVAWYYFTGKKSDDESGLIYFGARYYNPALGRFITADTIVQSPSNPQTLNRYSYAGNNPVNHVDPDGHSFWKKIGNFFKKAAGIIIGVAITAVTFGAGAPLALAIGVGAFVGTTGGAVINGVPLGQAFALGAVAGLSGGFGAHFAIGAGFWQGMAIGAGFGAVGGAASAGILGTDPLLGTLAGGVGGGIMGALGGALPEAKLSNLAKLGIGVGTAAGAGAASAAIARGNVGEGAALGGFGYFASSVAFSLAVDNHIVNNRKTRSALDHAWKDSQAGSPHEEGGWFRFGKGGRIEADRWQSGGRRSLAIPPKPGNAIATYHTHPNSGPLWEQGPSGLGGDISYAHYSGLDGLVVSKTDIYSYSSNTPIDDGRYDAKWPR